MFVDGAQWVAHGPTDVQELGVDFYAFSGHKLYGPTGIGVLWGRRALLDAMSPYHGGGDMIETVTWERTTYAPIPNKFEAGTPHIAGAVGLAAAMRWLRGLDLDAVAAHETALQRRCEDGLRTIAGVRIIGNAPPAEKAAVVSFVHEGGGAVGSYDLGTALDKRGIAVRTGHHCTQPVMDRLGIPGTTRASFAVYNTPDEVDRLIEAVAGIVADAKPAAPAPAGGDLPWPEATAGSVAEAEAALAEEFALVSELMKPDEYVLDFADTLPAMPEGKKTDATRVHGCMSTVHLIADTLPDGRMTFLADSDAHLVRGLIALLQKLYAGQKPREILDHDVNAFLRRIGLEQQLSMGRRNGLAGVIQRVRGFALSLTD